MRFDVLSLGLRVPRVGAWLLTVLIGCATSVGAAELAPTELRLPSEEHALPIQFVDSAGIRIDGRLDEPIWSTLPVVDSMRVVDPDSGEPGRFETHTRFVHTRRGLYVGIYNVQPVETLVGRLSSRDSFMRRDSVQVIVDSSGEGIYGYYFQVALGGTVGDGIVLPERNFERSWDGPWHGAASRDDNGWSAEFFLPWAMMNMPASDGDTRRMGIVVIRELGQLNETWGWPYLPRTQPRFMSALQPIEVRGVEPRQEYSVFPYLAASRDGSTDTHDVNAGADVFWRPSPNFNLYATLNPDFGQVEADDVVINFSAFETFFPEKRLFFIENQEVFIASPRATWNSPVTMLHTRRIGSSVNGRRGSPDALDVGYLDGADANRPVDLEGAVKTAGQIGNVRYGFLSAFEADTPIAVIDGLERVVDVPGREFGVARLSHEVVNAKGRRAVGWMGTVASHPDRDAVVNGVDFHRRTASGRFGYDAQLLVSDTDGTSGVGAFVDASFSPKRGDTHSFSFDCRDDELDLNDLGFLNRNDIVSTGYGFSRREANGGVWRERRTSINSWLTYSTDMRFLGGNFSLNRRWEYQNQQRINSRFSYQPASWDDRNSRGNGDFRREEEWRVAVDWNTDFAKSVIYGLGMDVRTESEGGTRRQLSGSITLRPVDRLHLSLRTNYTQRDAWLLYRGERDFSAYESEQWSPRFRVDAFFTAKQQLRFELEWAAIKAYEGARFEVPEGGGALQPGGLPTNLDAADFAVSDLVMQLRYRWQLAPLSDLFVVYNRGGRLPTATVDDTFPQLFSSVVSDADADFVIMKLRYRFGS